MAPVPAIGLLARLLGYVLFVVWCAVVMVAAGVVSLVRLARLATLWRGREAVADGQLARVP